MSTIQKLAADSIAVQNASNLSGVVHSFSAAMKELADLGMDTEIRNSHPIAILYASKIASLTGCENAKKFSNAYNYVADVARLERGK